MDRRRAMYMTMYGSALMLAASMTSCISWSSGWLGVETRPSSGNAQALVEKASAQLRVSDSAAKVKELVKSYEAILSVDPMNYEALWSAARYNALLGKAYSENNDERKRYYIKTIRLCERAMYTNREFKKLVDAGEPVWTACRALGKKEIEAMAYWNVGVGYYWRYCLGAAGKIINVAWTMRAKKVLDRLYAVDPEWGGGHGYSMLAGYYCILPGIAGGDLNKAEVLFGKAVAAAPTWLYVRWGRALYLHTKTGDREAFRADLQWVIGQDPKKADSPYPWNVYFQRSGREMLAKEDEFF